MCADKDTRAYLSCQSFRRLGIWQVPKHIKESDQIKQRCIKTLFVHYFELSSKKHVKLGEVDYLTEL